MELYDHVSAIFNPRVTTDFQYPETVNFIGKRLYWQASWVIEDGSYAGQFAMCVQVTSDEERTPFVWVPGCDLADVKHEDGREVHTRVMTYLQRGKTAAWTGADQIIEGQGVRS